MVSYHSQREQTRLTEPSEQLAILDDFLDEDAASARLEREALWHAVERDRRELEEITASSEARLREVDFLRYQVSELEAAGYSAQELSDLTRERDRLRNVTDLLQSTAAAAGALSPEEGGGAIDSVAGAVSELEKASRYDETLSSWPGRLGGLSAELEDVLYELRSYVDELEADPNRLEVVEDRLAALRALERKYGDVEGYLEEARTRLDRLENVDEETAELEAKIEEGERRLGDLAARITAGRKRAAQELSAKVQENLADLNLEKTTFTAELVPTSPGPSGVERVEFVIRPNPGEPELPVRRYASGGELSRIMLAIRLAQERIEPWGDLHLRRGGRRHRRGDGHGGRGEAAGARRTQPGPHHHAPAPDRLRGPLPHRRLQRGGGGPHHHPHPAGGGRGAPQRAGPDALGPHR